MEGDILLGPSYVEHFQVILDNANLFLLVRLVKVLQDNSDVHVDNNHVADDYKRRKVCYG